MAVLSSGELLGAWASVFVLGLALLGASWRAGSTLQGIRDDLRDHARRLEILEAWHTRVTSAAGLWDPPRGRGRAGG